MSENLTVTFYIRRLHATKRNDCVITIFCDFSVGLVVFVIQGSQRIPL